MDAFVVGHSFQSLASTSGLSPSPTERRYTMPSPIVVFDPETWEMRSWSFNTIQIRICSTFSLIPV
jgi:hypothetical protein